MSDTTRSMGLAERYSLVRSLISSQPIPIVLVNLIPPPPHSSETLLPRVYAALASLLPLHPTLFVRYTNIHSSSPGLAFLPSVDVRKVVSVETQGGDIDAMLERVMERELVLEVEKEGGEEEEGELTPPWRVLLWFPEDVKDGFWIGFVGHHSLFDGAAAMTFPKALVAALSTSQTSPTSPSPPLVVPLPPSPSFPPTLESIHSLSVSLFTLLPLVFTEMILPKLPSFLRPSPPPSTWTGRSQPSSSSPPAAHPRRKKHLTFQLPSSTTQPLLNLCRKNGTSLTSLLHTLLARSIRSSLLRPEDDATLKSVTAISLRPPHLQTLLGGTYVGIFPQTITPPPNPPNPNNNDDETETIWSASRSHHSLLRHPSVVPSALEQWGLLSYVSPSSKADPNQDGWAPFFLPKTDLNEWQLSFELSNLGRVEVELGGEEEGWKVGGKGGGGVVFTQSAQARGPAMVVSMVGWEGGLGMGFAWEEGGLEGGREGVRRVWEEVEREMGRLVGL